jgi:hypothetical protein
MSSAAFDLDLLGFELDEHGFAGREPAIAEVVRLAKSYGLGSRAAIGVLADTTAPVAARMRAFGQIAAALLPVSGDRLAPVLRAVA